MNSPSLQQLPIDLDYLQDILRELLRIPSPTGYTDAIVRFTCQELDRLEIPYELTRRGAIRATMTGSRSDLPGRALIAHLDTLGAMVTGIKDNGRLQVASIGTWSARFAEGARVTILRSDAPVLRGTILPLKASGHIFNTEVDSQPSAWSNLEVRVDDISPDHGVQVGDYVAVDSQPEFTDTGYINARHLDDKAGVACLLAAARAVRQAGITPPITLQVLFTLAEEVGVGASAVLHGDIAEMVAIDNATPGPGQNSTETGITIAMMDMTGPFDFHLTRQLIELCRQHELPFRRDVFKCYRCDAASAIEAGNDLRTALICFGVDASHGWERTHIDSLHAVTRLLSLYIQSPQAIQRDRHDLAPLRGFPTQPHPEIKESPSR